MGEQEVCLFSSVFESANGCVIPLEYKTGTKGQSQTFKITILQSVIVQLMLTMTKTN